MSRSTERLLPFAVVSKSSASAFTHQPTMDWNDTELNSRSMIDNLIVEFNLKRNLP